LDGRKRLLRAVLPLSLAWTILLACNLEVADSKSAGISGPSPTPTRDAAAANTAERSATAGAATPSETVPADTPTPTLTVVHWATPPGAAGTTRYITDPETRDYASQKKAPSGSDLFASNRYERPYTAGAMDYLSDVDLKRVEMKIAAPWVYITFEFIAARAEGIGRTMYGAEFDTDQDGRGEFLVGGVAPANANWTTDGVEVRGDSNSDVGGSNPQKSDPPNPGADGYERMIFSGGQGADPDLAWIRQAGGGAKVQLAFKYSAIGNAPQFFWNGLADDGIRKPDWFDYNDHFTAAEAGSPFPAQADLYPLKALAGIDNTCRDAYGFTPTGLEIGLCQYYGTIAGVVAWDIDHNGSLDATERTIALIGGDTVTLGQGGCPSAPYQTAVTNSEGRYSFPDLPIGTYCVGLLHTIPNPISVPPATVRLAPGQDLAVDFPVPW
jgi:hypothetical protein